MDRDRGGARRHTRTAIIAPAVITLAILAANATTNAGNASTTATTSNVAIESTVTALAAPVVGLAATPSGKGYWRVGADGGVLTAGDAIFYGSAAGFAHDTIVAIAATRSGHGYWLTDRQGAVFSFGDAAFHGSMGGKRLNLPIVGMAATPNGSGYWLVASDGGIFAFNAPFFGSTGSIHLNQPITGMAAAPNGTGYTMVAADGGLFRFGTNSPFYGSAVGACPGAPAVAVAMSPGATGYWIAFADARTYAFSPSSPAPQCNPSTSSVIGLMAADLFARANDERAARHLAPVSWDPTLANYAAAWSADMASHGFRHSAIGNLLGPYNYVGENIAAGGATTLVGSLHNAWMHSDGHRANILAPGFTRMGVGVFCSANGSIWLTEDFGHPSSAGPAQTSSTTPPVDPIARPDSGTLHC
jgi:uncharacterized protein YkwD